MSLPAAGGILLAGWSGAAAADTGIVAGNPQVSGATVELIDNSRLGCGSSLAQTGSQSGQCAFDNATKGARVTAVHDFGDASLEAFATVARTTTGAFTPDQLLVAPVNRSSHALDFFLVGFKGSAFDKRLKLSAEFARSQHATDLLVDRGWGLAESYSEGGTSALLKVEGVLADRPGLHWSMSGEYRSVSDDYSIGTSRELLRHHAMAGTRLALSTKARLGELFVSAGLEQHRSPFGESASGKAAIDYEGIALTVRSRVSTADPLEGSSLIDSSTRTKSTYLDLDTQTLADRFLPGLNQLPDFVPSAISLSWQSSETDNRYESGQQRYRRSSIGIDGTWETPIGETSLGYWRDDRRGLTATIADQRSETFQASHSVRHGNWRFGLDASLSRYSGDGARGFEDRELSFGQSVAYSAPGGPEFRLLLGQDRASTRQLDEFYVSSDSYSSVTASLDLSAYLQKRFERPDLRLTLDYRKALERSEAELNLYDELVERWSEDYRREGILLSFGMKL